MLEIGDVEGKTEAKATVTVGVTMVLILVGLRGSEPSDYKVGWSYQPSASSVSAQKSE